MSFLSLHLHPWQSYEENFGNVPSNSNSDPGLHFKDLDTPPSLAFSFLLSKEILQQYFFSLLELAGENWKFSANKKHFRSRRRNFSTFIDRRKVSSSNPTFEQKRVRRIHGSYRRCIGYVVVVTTQNKGGCFSPTRCPILHWQTGSENCLNIQDDLVSAHGRKVFQTYY